MLDLLAKYGQKYEPEPGFKPKEVRWAIIFDSKSGFQALVELGQPDQKKNKGRTFNKCPDLSQSELVSGSETKCHFLVETASVVALYNIDAEETKTRDKHRDKHKYFIYLLEKAGKDLENPALATIAEWLKNSKNLEVIQKALTEKKVKPTDKVTLCIDGEFPVEQDYWQNWWRTFRRNMKGESGTENKTLMRCYVTGELALPLKTHPKIEGLAGDGGLASGDVLVGFDKEAYCSYGLDQSANAAISEEAAHAYRTGLNDLLKNHSQRLVKDKAKVVHWYKKSVQKEEDPLMWLEDPPELAALSAQRAARELLKSIQTGARPDIADNYYYALTLSGAKGRVMVRDWMEGQFEQLVLNISQWFDDLEIVQPDGNSPAHYPKFTAVLGSLVAPHLDDLPAPTVAKLWKVAVRGEPIPYAIMAQALTRRKVEIFQPNEKQINMNGMGIIKAYHLRKYRKEDNTIMAEKLKPVLNEDFPSAAYQCGRLMAVLADLQKAALGDVSAGVVQRYYAAASTTPALVLGRLTRNSQFHLNKLDPGLAYWYESKIAAIWQKLQEAPPRTLSLEEQSFFALGYYQQLADMRIKKSTNAEKEKEEVNG